MLDQTIELSNGIDAFHVSQMTFGDSWDEKSFGFESFSEEESEKEFGRLRRRHTCDCIDDALAILSSSSDERRQMDPILPSTSPLPPAFGFDLPPTHPRRSSDVVSKHFVIRSQSDLSHDRFQLSKSESISLSLRAPRRPRRSSDGSDCSDALPKGDTRPSLHLSERSHDIGIQPPSRTHSGNADRLKPSKLYTPSSHCRITLKGSAGRVLLGSRELSSSEHLRRSFPKGRTPCKS